MGKHRISSAGISIKGVWGSGDGEKSVQQHVSYCDNATAKIFLLQVLVRVSLCSSMVTGRPSFALLHYERLALCVGRLKAVSPARAQYLIGFAQYAARCVHLRGCSAAQMIPVAVLNFR